VQVFDVDVNAARERFAEQSWVHLSSAMTDEFLGALNQASERYLQTAKLAQHAIAGKKEQALYALPESLDYQAELLTPIAEVCGLDAGALTLSERHIQSYDEQAAPHPKPHKDRYASQVSVGFTIAVPEGTSLLIWPETERDINTNEKACYRETWPDAEPVVLFDQPGDVVMFQGNSTWHLRRNSAGSINLYIKVNEYGSDPLGEDPRHAAAGA
jgi:hypothetical protein